MATVSDHITLDCPFCFKKFTTPRVLPCSHSFCEECLGEYIKTHTQDDGSSFTCPHCATPTVPSDSTLTIEKWASAFPLNSLINSLSESTKNMDKSCEPCKIDGETSSAEYWCAKCSEKLCNSCYKSHKRMKQLKHHEIIAIHEMEEHTHLNFDFNQVCSRHRVKVKELFCIDHRELCCAVCVVTDHRQCNDVRTIDDIARDQSQRSTYDYPSIIQDFGKLKTEMEKIMTQKKINAKRVLQEKDQILRDMDNRIDTIIRHLNKLKNDFRNETEQMYKETERSMVENQKNVESFIINIDNSSEILKVVFKHGTLQQKFTTFEHHRSQIMSHYNQLYLRLKDDVEVLTTLKGSKLLYDFEETLNSVGFVGVLKKSSTMSSDVLYGADEILKNLNSRTNIGTKVCFAQVKKVEDFMMSQVTFVKSVTRDKLGSFTDFTGGTFLGNGRLVMCDFTNRRLVELDDEYNVVKKHTIDGKPADIATGNRENELYIVVRTTRKRYIYKCTLGLHTDLKIVSIIKAPSGTFGISVSGDNIIVGTDYAALILTQDGSTVRSIPKEGIYSYVYVSPTQRTIYHRDNEDVVCRTWEGPEVFRYRHHQLTGPRGMCVDRQSFLGFW